MTSDDAKLAELERLAKAATPGPWRRGGWSGRCLLDHVHRGASVKESPCVHTPRFNEGLTSHVATAERPGGMVVDSDYDGVLCAPDDAAFIAAADPTTVLALVAELKALRAMGDKINTIRNNIVGAQGVHFSRDIYPLVAALNEAGFEAKSYEDAREGVRRVNAAMLAVVTERDEARACLRAVFVWLDAVEADDRDEEIERAQLRARCRRALGEEG